MDQSQLLYYNQVEHPHFVLNRLINFLINLLNLIYLCYNKHSRIMDQSQLLYYNQVEHPLFALNHLINFLIYSSKFDLPLL